MLEAVSYAAIWMMYVVAIIIATEVFAYLWHRFGAHSDLVPGLHDTHKIHHEYSLDAAHEADEDFVWVLLLMVYFELAVGVALMLGFISGPTAIVTVIVALTVLWWNWWIHRAYHHPDHWLNSYQWFVREKDRHFVHHQEPRNNYGIASHIGDVLFNTWTEALGDCMSSGDGSPQTWTEALGDFMSSDNGSPQTWTEALGDGDTSFVTDVTLQ